MVCNGQVDDALFCPKIVHTGPYILCTVRRHVHISSGRQLNFPGTLHGSTRVAEPKFDRVES